MVLDRSHPRVYFSNLMPLFCPASLVAYVWNFVYHVLARFGSHSLRFPCVHGFAIHYGQFRDKPSLCLKLKLSFEALLQHHFTLPWSSSATKSTLHQARYWEAPQVTCRPHPSCYLYSSSTRRYVCTRFPAKTYSYVSSKATRSQSKKKICILP